MNCSKCGERTLVVESRNDGEIIARKRKCVKCNHMFYTTEARRSDAHFYFNEIVRSKKHAKKETLSYD